MHDPSELYRLLLRLYPARFREEFAEPLELQFQDDYRGVGGRPARMVFWARALRDLAVSIPAEILHEMAQDLRTSARIYRRRPLATGLAVIALAMAIGVTTGVFSVLNGVMFRGLPFRDPERLVHLEMDARVAGRAGVRAWGDRSPYLAGAAEFSTAEMNLNQAAGASRTTVTETSGNFFRVLGVEPELGRAFTPDEDARGANGVAVIGHGLWRQFFGGDPGVLGSTVRVNGVPLTVVGVAPPGMDYPERTGLWSAGLWRLPRTAGVVSEAIVGRLKPGVTMAQAKAMFKAELLRAYPESYRESAMRRSLFTSLRDGLAGPVRRASTVLFAAVLLVLFIACANVAQLLLSRTNERRRELSVRAALGASRARLVQQLITEATALTLTGAVLGFPVAYWVSVLAARVEPAPLAAQAYALLDWRVLAFTAAATVFTGVVFGVLPALAIRRAQPAHEIMRGQPGAAGLGSGRIRVGLVALQAALTVVLLAGCIVMSRSFLTLLGADLGFQTDHIVSMRASVAGIYDKNRELQFYNAALEGLGATPGVEAAGAIRYLPLIDGDYKYLGGRYVVAAGGEVTGNIPRNSVTAGYFRAMGIDFVAGRNFTAAERRGKDRVAIVDEVFARQSGLGAGIVGKTAVLDMGRLVIRYMIVGVVRATRLGGPASEPTMQVYEPLEQSPPGSMTFVARVPGSAGAYLRACQAALQRVDPEISIYDAQSLDQRLSGNLLRPRFYTTAILFLGVFALLLAVIGIYGVAAYSVTQRTHEIGVRIALGAAPGRLRAALVRQGMLPVVAGMAVGVAGAIASGRFLKSLMWSAEPPGALTCIVGGLLLTATALAALWFATSRVIQVDPMTALKSD
jgi:putative ABC transport system permease protein